jgi:hypothetical protein
LAVATGAAPALAPPAPHAETPRPWHPVECSYLAGAAAQLRAPGRAPLGANDPSCRPSAAHPNPVVLLHGFASTDTVNWHTLAPLLADAGYCVFTTVDGRIADTGVGGLTTARSATP